MAELAHSTIAGQGGGNRGAMTLEIMLLGPPRVQRDGAPVVIDAGKATGLARPA
jgi:hypothetical protein